MNYQQLTEGRRYQISALLERGISVSEIAKTVQCHRSTVYREIKRGRKGNIYCPNEAQLLSIKKRRTARKYRIPKERVDFIRLLLETDWSPEQISNVLTKVGAAVSHEWIYRFVAQDKRLGGKLYRHLRQGHKRYRRGKKEKAPAIKNAVSIDDRPSIVDSKERFGDWEIDTVLGKHGTGAMVTILERKTRFYVVKKVPSKSADDVTKATIELLKPYKKHVHTITADNGREFAGHETIAKELEADVYFAHPYSSWERGANENANGLLRQYVKKGTDLTTVTDIDIEFALSRINYRPRKCLGFKQPAIVFEETALAA
ncbi:and there are a few more such examples along the aa-chain (ex R Arg changed with H His) [Vibrio sp. B1FLJ16]|uniref:IS30 family transposase n=1 Tax=Vibrio sp. B1FLJ16 TaxID=2751178 RepID=UPI0015F423B0|nr:IS30 family transposase [Vibrio sp. B1FLJ16]CAD7820840.1 and there are a few more such examples along the aa-chain (ex R Arg changed with H His) [Vibrio sp. B1FLJ16]CAE6944425.1 and there are a few more such examples along the aa-chain (ex R Arg changed with H His) [Vibrio sp. B1FLJ16]